MTLTKVKPRRPSAEHRKRLGHHHRHSHDYLKTYWPYMPVLAILSLGIVVNSWLGHVNKNVLGYATDMSTQTLLDDTNTQRAANGEAGLTLNAQLDTAAQNKANDMAARDYWSHNTPDGQTPWTFITAAGYQYQTAGENLAYGFATADDTITGWMNSPEHRANILNTSFVDVGFGFVNIPNYQNSGPETLVVAMYTSPLSAPVAAATPKPAAPVKTETPVTVAQATPTPAPAPVATSSPPVVTQPAATAGKASTSDTLEPTQQSISRIQLVASTNPVSEVSMVAVGLLAGAMLVLRHSLAWRRRLVRSESFVLHHPLFDIAAVSLVSLSIVLSHTAGLIR